MIVRYADDFVMGFEKKSDAEEMLLALKARLAGFGLTIQDAVDRVWAVRGPLTTAAWRAATRDLRLSGLHPLLRHYCGRTRDGRFIVKHKTEGKRLTRKLTALRQDA
ncbi:hypothetical protein NKI95_32865 [Mesorhizobium sp. M0306]|uniref:hypothetical protein n=1 Tax=Mesorhizobium sp. M0306 TaxID=2956932 RepID=UPI003337BE24